MDTSKLKEGQFFYKPHRRSWGVWKVSKISEDGTRICDFITDFSTQIQAEKFVYTANGWAAGNSAQAEE